jgi:O-antigen/teichoic acid export membrane protein
MYKNIFYSLISKGIVAGINFLILIFSSRYLGVSSRGEISIFILNVTVIQIVNEIYTGYSIVHFIPKFNLKKIIGFGLIYTLIFCSLSNAIVCFLRKQVPGNEWMGYMVSLLVIINTFNCVIILGKQNMKLYNLLSVIQPLILLLGLGFSIFILKDYTFSSYLYPLLFSFSVAFIVSVYHVVKYAIAETSVQKFELQPILVNGLIFQAGTLMYIFANRYSYYLLADNASVGLYSSASSLTESVLIIANGISPVLLSKIANQDNTVKSSEIALTLSMACFVFSAFVLLIILALPENFYVSVLGTGFAGIRLLMILYAPGVLMVSLFITISNYFLATGKQSSVLLCYSLGFASTLVCTPVLIQKYDVYGAPYAAIVTYFIMAVSICATFIITNKISVKRFFSFSGHYRTLKQLITSG